MYSTYVLMNLALLVLRDKIAALLMVKISIWALGQVLVATFIKLTHGTTERSLECLLPNVDHHISQALRRSMIGRSKNPLQVSSTILVVMT